MTDTTPLKEAHDEAEDLLALIDIGIARAHQLAEQSRRILDIKHEDRSAAGNQNVQRMAKRRPTVDGKRAAVES